MGTFSNITSTPYACAWVATAAVFAFAMLTRALLTGCEERNHIALSPRCIFVPSTTLKNSNSTVSSSAAGPVCYRAANP